ncbi:hypothetical protein ACLBKU_14365 [Erythrobacter sp. NE805]|uniref:hypothetical protein n=1 Tax=Erythrobacter sp. NE805 TaxID=3389875 RepID=UPI00396B3228
MADLAAEAVELPDCPGARVRGEGVLSMRQIARGAPCSPDVAPLALPGACGVVTQAAGLALVSLAPGDWIVLGATPDLAAIAARNAARFLCVDCTHGRLVLELEAGLAARALAAFCPLDPARDLAPGRAAASLFGDADATFFAQDCGSLVMIVDRSLADYVGDLLRSIGPA